VRTIEPETLEIEAEDTSEGCVLRLRGELDFFSAGAFDAAVARTARPDATLELDLDGLTFVDSTGIRAIIAAKKLCEERACFLMLARPTARTRRLFRLSRLLDHLPFAGHTTSDAPRMRRARGASAVGDGAIRD
jgi:anti-anti-sigma factor